MGGRELTSGAKLKEKFASNVAVVAVRFILPMPMPRHCRSPSPKGMYLLAIPSKSPFQSCPSISEGLLRPSLEALILPQDLSPKYSIHQCKLFCTPPFPFPLHAYTYRAVLFCFGSFFLWCGNVSPVFEGRFVWYLERFGRAVLWGAV